MPADAEPDQLSRDNIEATGNTADEHDVSETAAESGSEDDNAEEGDAGSEEEDEEEDEEDEEPKLKYSRMTKSLGAVYRNGDAVSSMLTAGDKMILGTHNGNLHILGLPSLYPLRTYHAHSASITSVSISPPPPVPIPLPGAGQQGVRYIPTWKHIFIATSSIDGHVFITPLIPPPASVPIQAPNQKELLLKSFGRPVLSVALSPNFYNDRTFLSGGLAGSLVLSQNDRPGSRLVSNLANVTNATPASWLGSALGGLTGGSAGKDVVLHGGDGAVSSITWSRESARFVAWGTEMGIKIMRSHMFDSIELDILRGAGVAAAERVGAWKRICSLDRPESIPEDLSGVYKPKIEWVDRRTLVEGEEGQHVGWEISKERVVIGWGPHVWVLNVTGVSKDTADLESKWGYAETVNILQTDGTIAGISLYNPSTLLLLVHIVKEQPASESPAARPIGRTYRNNALLPELRLISLITEEEESADQLLMSRFEGLQSSDYHLSTLPPTPVPPTGQGSGTGSQSGTPKTASARESMLSGIPGSEFITAPANGLWAAGLTATTIFSSAISLAGSQVGSPTQGTAPGSFRSQTGVQGRSRMPDVATDGWGDAAAMKKVYIASPYDLVFATERSNKDHLAWMLEKEKYEAAWTLVDEHPEIMEGTLPDETASVHSENVSVSPTATDDGSMAGTLSKFPAYDAAVKEKRRIGELWLQSLINESEWDKAGKVAGKVLDTSSTWERWVWVFKAAGKIRAVTPYIPTEELSPRLSSIIYETVLATYLAEDLALFKELFLERWNPAKRLFDVDAVLQAIEGKVISEFPHVEDIDDPSLTSKGPEITSQYTILEECLAGGYEAISSYRSALTHYTHLKRADEALHIIRKFHLLEAISTNIPKFLLLRVSKTDLDTPSNRELLEKLTSEPVALLVEEASHGMLLPDQVISQLQGMKSGPKELLSFFYLRQLWQSTSVPAATWSSHSDKLLTLLARFSRSDLGTFLKTSNAYTLSHAEQLCVKHDYIPELVYLYSQTGKSRQALHLLINSLADVPGAIALAKSVDDPAIWDELVELAMDKPVFIVGLLKGVGTSIDPVKLIRRIPGGLQVPGLKGAVESIVREYAVTASISEGVKKVCRAEVMGGMRVLRGGRSRGVRVDIDTKTNPDLEVEKPLTKARTGLCAGCADGFTSAGLQKKGRRILAFACGHVFHLDCFRVYPKLVDVAREEEEDDPGVRALDAALSGGGSLGVGTKTIKAQLLRKEIVEEMEAERGEDWEWGCRVCRENSGGKGGALGWG